MKRKRLLLPLNERFPPSAPCSCAVCRAYCARPGWWTVDEASRALLAGYGPRMMLELSPDRSYGVLSPAFRGCEGTFALQAFAHNGCNFFHHGLCGLYGTGFEPLECRYCHHAREGKGMLCHDALAQDWLTPAGQALVRQWIQTVLYSHGLPPCRQIISESLSPCRQAGRTL